MNDEALTVLRRIVDAYFAERETDRQSRDADDDLDGAIGDARDLLAESVP